MNQSINKEKYFLLVFAIWTIINLINQSTIIFQNNSEVIKLINLFIGVFLLFKEINSIEEDKKTLSVIGITGLILFLLLMFFIRKNSYGILFFDIGLFIFSARDIDFKRIAKVSFGIDAVVLLSVITLNRMGKLASFFVQNLSIEDGKFRNSLGFSYTSFPSQIAFYMTLCYVVMRNKKIKTYELIILELVNIYIYSKTLTSNPFVWSTIVLLYIFVSNNLFKKNFISGTPIIKEGVKFSFLIAPAILFWILFKAPQSIFFMVDKFVHNRLELSVLGIKNWGISMLGQPIHFITSTANSIYQYNYIDSFYVQQLVVDGWLFTIIILILFTIVMIHEVNIKNDILVMCLVAVAFHAMFDPQLIWIWYSPFALLLGKAFLKDMDYKLN